MKKRRRGNAATLDVLTSSGKDDWCTPPEVLRLVRLVGPIGLDPCWNPGALSSPRVRAWLDDGRDGLQLDWAAEVAPGEVVFVNPPYSTLESAWGHKLAAEGPRVRAAGAHLVAIVPARTDTRWWQPMWTADAICFWRGRVHFLDKGVRQAGAPFPSAVVWWGPGPRDSNVDRGRPRFSQVFERRGHVVSPKLVLV